MATHTCPWLQLNGHPRRGDALDMLAAYSGNSRIGDLLARHAGQIDLLACGHTHHVVRETTLHGVRSLNIGADYGIFRAVIFDTRDRSVRWIGEPLAGA